MLSTGLVYIYESKGWGAAGLNSGESRGGRCSHLLRLALGHLREAPASEHNVDHDLQVPHPRREGGAVIARALEEEDRSRDDLCGNQISGAPCHRRDVVPVTPEARFPHRYPRGRS